MLVNRINLINGFTLAEILITLAIIGVIAAATIPNLIKNTQNSELKTAFKKNYSMLNQAIAQITNDNGGAAYNCYPGNTSECGIFWSSLKNSLNVIKEDSNPVNGINIPNYTGTDLITAQGGHVNNVTCNGGNEALKNQKMSWSLADGSIIFSYSTAFSSSTFFFVDTNGLKKPNKWGYDLFSLNLNKKSANDPLLIEDIVCGAQEKGGFNIKDILLNQ